MKRTPSRNTHWKRLGDTEAVAKLVDDLDRAPPVENDEAGKPNADARLIEVGRLRFCLKD